MRPATTRCFSLTKIPPQFLDALRTLHSFLDAPRPALEDCAELSGRVENREVFLDGLAVIQKKDLAKFGYRISVFFFFFSPIFSCWSKSGDQPQGDLAKSGYKTNREIENLGILLHFG
jgi:hypothetical protein